jgi:hypothetical protein
LLVERAVAAAVEAYVAVLELPSPPPLALVLLVYFDGDAPYQLTPPPIAIPREKLEWCAANDCLPDLFLPWDPEEFPGTELELPEVSEDAALIALLDAINADWDEGEGLLETYFARLAPALHSALGVFVIVDGWDTTIDLPEREQLLAQMTPAQVADWEAKDWLPRNRMLDELDVVIAQRVGDDAFAMVFVRDGVLCGASPLREPRYARELTRPVVALGSDPMVVGGRLPAGAVAVSVQDLFDVWHDALVGGGAWLCVLPHEARGGLPPVVFRDAAGVEIVPEAPEPNEQGVSFGFSVDPDAKVDWAAVRAAQEAECRRILAGASVPALWPVDAARAPKLRGWGGSGAADSLELARGQLAVSIDGGDFNEADVRDVLQRALEPRIGARAAARAVLEAVEIALPGSIAGKAETFAALAAGGRWVAVRQRRSRTVTVTGAGALPERLDLESLPPDAVESWFAADEDG